MRVVSHMFLLTLGLSCLLVSARGADPTEPVRRIRFRLLSWQREVTGLHAQLGGGREQELIIPAYGPSDPYRFQGAGPLVLYTLGEDAEGNPVREPRATVPLDRIPDEALVVVFEAKNGKYECVAIRDDFKSFPAGHYQIINFSRQEVGVRCGTETARIPSLGSRVMKATPSQGSATGLLVFREVDNHAKILFSNAYPFYEEMRVLVFLYQPPDQPDGGYVIKRIAESDALKATLAVPTPMPVENP